MNIFTIQSKLNLPILQHNLYVHSICHHVLLYIYLSVCWPEVCLLFACKLLEGEHMPAFFRVVFLEFSTVAANSLYLLHICQMNKKEEI